MPLIGFSAYAGAWFTGSQLKAVDILIALGFFSQMRGPVLLSFPAAIEKLSQLRLAWQRIDKLIQLLIKEGEQTLHTSDNNNYQQKGAITMRNASFSWNGHDDCLSSLNIDIAPGILVGITGVVGSGKSSLFAAILGEMIQTQGEVNINNSSFAYAPQSPWIFSDTLRANILFEKPYDEQRYMNVLHACCLDIDLTMLGPREDLTIIGEKGVNLSGGQKARVSLARSLYADVDIYLLDDPLAALDCIVAKRIYDQCIGPKSLLKNKTRLLITHQTQFLTDIHQTIILAHGHIELQGNCYVAKTESEEIDQKNERIEEETAISPDMLEIGQRSITSESIIVDETSKIHNISYSLWYSLFTAPPLGLFGLFIMIILVVLGEILYDGTYLWLAQWSQRSENNHDQRSVGIKYFLFIMVTLIAAVGRSAGKSSLFQGLLRLVHRSTVDGTILIDDIDISRVTLSHLRSHISILPQQFVLFTGTLRSNIDPLDVYTDEQCWAALESVQLKTMASDHPAGLLMPVAESGSNLSVGQRQLVCLCRAILKPSKILLIDEATANVDTEGDRMFQMVIKKIAKNRTVLTIAHRLSTVTGNDRLLALDNGTVVDFDVPDKVLLRFQ
ncbi:unnamed protein product [Rotaria sp. Silwood1]|nr:unnamed protein product [Rotaria sp. Silwood1]CAF4871420.1 unnamed protein product [Rotaria sp. Silwood1]CAF4877462.1 unnamed protein product [Rotaria sp. Silwood1]CAF4885941.1 unnamed protein product [Rotaria sp. Silwood1]CAF4950171.1 unnamed protein product [Rotaria sp. Silwood1]